MGCGSSSGTAGVLSNSVTQNGRGRTHLQPESAASLKHSGLSDLNINDPELQEAATRIQAAYRGHRTRNSLKMAQEEEVIDINLDDPEVASAATKIQASFRGHQARKQAEKDKDKGDAELSENLGKLKANTEGEEEMPDLSDPELNKAATKIQATFRGHMIRKDKENE